MNLPRADVVMLGTFSAWNLGTIQARALPLATELRALGLHPAIIVTPWDMTSEAGVLDIVEGIPIVNTAAASARNPLPAIRQQIDWARRLDPQLVHVFKPKGFAGFSSAWLSKTRPLIVDSDDWEGDGGWNQAGGYSYLQQRVFQRQEQDLLRRALHVTAASTLLAERARALRAQPGETVHSIPNGLTRGRWRELSDARQTSPGAIDPPVILLYSRFAEFETDWLASFIHALTVLVDRKVTVRVVGDVQSQTCPPLSVGDVYVEMLGYVAWERIPALLGTTSVAVYPYRDSLITRAKQSVKLLEQMAAGCPIIASEVGDIANTLGPAGTVLTGGSPQQFAREAADLLRHPERPNSLSERAIERAGSRFLFDNLARQLLDVYVGAGLRR